MKVISSTEARKNFSELLNIVKYQKMTIAIGRNNKPEVLMIPVSYDGDIPITEINSMSSSFDFLNDEPELYTLNDLREKNV